MIIEGVLRYRGSSMDLFSPLYFEDADDLKAMMANERVVLYGYRLTDYKLPILTAIRVEDQSYIDKLVISNPLIKDHENRALNPGDPRAVDKYYFELSDENIGDTEAKTKFWKDVVIDDPDIPPGDIWISSTTSVSSNHLRARYITAYDDSSVVCYSLDQNRNFEVSISGSNVIVKDYKRKLSTGSCLAFCNGMCCKTHSAYNDTLGDHLVIENCTRFYKNQRDVKRGTVIVEFKGTEVSFLDVFADMSKLHFNKPSDGYQKYSFLLSISNKLYLPDEFKLLDNTTRLTIAMSDNLDPAVDLDTKVACNEFNLGTRNLSTKIEKLSAKADAGKVFVIAIKRPGMKLIRHKSSNFPNDTAMTNLNQSSLSTIHRIFFDGCARGLLFDKSTRAVHEYFVEYANQSFPLKDKEKLGRWDRAIAWVNLCTPIEIWGSTHNHMSAHASMHDCRKIRGSSLVLWPRFEMLDFIFEK